MSTSNDTQIESVLRKQVCDIATLVDAGQYSKAMGTVKSAKAVYPKNIFIIALEKQLEKLTALSTNPTLSDPERQKELQASIPALIQRSVEGMDKEEPTTLHLSQPSGEREAAFAKLKEEYFQLADGYVARGEYDQALQEIKRVLILEPENSLAREYQEKIQELLQLKEKSGTKRSIVHEEKSKVEAQPLPRVHERAPEPKQPVRKENPIVASQPEAPPHQEPRSSSSKKFILAGIPVLVVAIATAYFLTSSEQPEQNSVPSTASNSKSVASPAQNADMKKSDPVQTVTKPQQGTGSALVVADPQPSPSTTTPIVQPVAVANKDIAATKMPSGETSAPIKDLSSQKTSGGIPKELTKDNVGGSIAQTPATTLQSPTETRNISDPRVSESKPREDKAQDAVVEEPKAPQLAKLEVKQGVSAASSVAETPTAIKMTERKAEIIRLVNPKFPEAAQRAGIQGEVLVRVQIDPAGNPVQAKIVKSSSEVFNDAVIDAVMHSQYSPGVMSTGPVTSWITLPFTFKMKKN